MYEMILSACSTKEEGIWRDHLKSCIAAENSALADGNLSTLKFQSCLALDMRSIGKAFGKPGSFIRRMSVHRTATLGPSTDINQVIIKNTQAPQDDPDNQSSTSLSIARSQSVMTPSHVPTLAPRRADRVRLETALAD
ncbi:hypothetical protein LTR66_012459, partial [Elasticomyces elasticus]